MLSSKRAHIQGSVSPREGGKAQPPFLLLGQLQRALSVPELLWGPAEVSVVTARLLPLFSPVFMHPKILFLRALPSKPLAHKSVSFLGKLT